jgi:hypothetical protein
MEVMPDQLNKQAVVNLLIDSPLREPIKINLIDIVNNTPDPDLSKVFPTIVKELEIFQKATERRMKLADETIAKLGGAAPTGEPAAPMTPPADTSTAAPTPTPAMPDAPVASMPTPISEPVVSTTTDGLAAPVLDLPPLPTTQVPPSPDMAAPAAVAPATPMTEPALAAPTPEPSSAPLPTPAPLGGTPSTPQGDEAALAEIQKELDSLKTTAASEVTAAAAPAPPTPPQS